MVSGGGILGSSATTTPPEVFLGTGFFELRGGEMFFGQKKISRASRALRALRDPGEASLWGFWNPSALWWGQFDEMGKFLVLVKMGVR